MVIHMTTMGTRCNAQDTTQTEDKHMNDNTYNGWTNRETWVINLWMGDYFSEIAEEGQQLTADYIEETIWDMFNEADIPLMFVDLISLCAVNWRELADHYTTEADFQAEVA